MPDLRADEDKSFNYFRMPVKLLEELAVKLMDKIKSEDTFLMKKSKKKKKCDKTQLNSCHVYIKFHRIIILHSRRPRSLEKHVEKSTAAVTLNDVFYILRFV